MGAWIEIAMSAMVRDFTPSLPLWERGLKYPELGQTVYAQVVAPLVGAWIEIVPLPSCASVLRVAPLVGAWIEIVPWYFATYDELSLPLWERGLKSDF